MTKEVCFDFLGLYRAMFDDITRYHPTDSREYGRDLERLAHLHQTRGIAVFTIDLPAIGKVLDRALAKGVLDRTSLPHTRGKKYGSVIPRLFWGLWRRLFDDSGTLVQDPDPNDVLFLRTLLYVGKELEGECSPRYLYEATNEFFRIEARIPEPPSFWDGDDRFDPSTDLGHLSGDFGGEGSGDLFSEQSSSTRHLLDSIQQSADRISTLIGEFIPGEAAPRHGPGAVSDLRSGSYKYNFPAWSPSLERIFPYDEFGSTGFDLMDRLQSDGIDIPFVEGRSVLIDVPKTMKGPRLIAKEPTCNQWIQQSIAKFLASRIEGTSLSLSVRLRDQSYNGKLALLGSRNGKYGTLDLKSASDRLSCRLVQRVFRKNPFLLESFRACRTRFLENGIDKKNASLIKLRKFSTQGSALTFPVQTLVFLSIVLGVGRHLTQGKLDWRQLGRRVRVYGDDIVAPSGWLPTLASALTLLGLKVNDTKTFYEGNFRESCGTDGWMGYEVTPPHVTTCVDRSKPGTVASWVAVSNNFFKKGFWAASNWMSSTIRMDMIPTVNHGSGVFGFTSFSKVSAPLAKRWNDKLHYFEHRVLAVKAKASIVKQDTATALLQYFTEEPEPYVKYESGVVVAGTPVFQRTWVPSHLF